jgi:hypothetical protein
MNELNFSICCVKSSMPSFGRYRLNLIVAARFALTSGASRFDLTEGAARFALTEVAWGIAFVMAA